MFPLHVQTISGDFPHFMFLNISSPMKHGQGYGIQTTQYEHGDTTNFKILGHGCNMDTTNILYIYLCFFMCSYT